MGLTFKMYLFAIVNFEHSFNQWLNAIEQILQWNLSLTLSAESKSEYEKRYNFKKMRIMIYSKYCQFRIFIKV